MPRSEAPAKPVSITPEDGRAGRVGHRDHVEDALALGRVVGDQHEVLAHAEVHVLVLEVGQREEAEPRRRLGLGHVVDRQAPQRGHVHLRGVGAEARGHHAGLVEPGLPGDVVRLARRRLGQAPAPRGRSRQREAPPDRPESTSPRIEAMVPPLRRGVNRQAAQATSRSFWASARDCSFFSDWFSIWRMRSRVTLKVRPTSSSVRGCSPPRP